MSTFLRSKIFIYTSILLAIFAVILLLVYVFLNKSISISNTFSELKPINKIEINTINSDINQLMHNFVENNSEQFQIAPAPVDVVVTDNGESGEILFSEPLIVVINRQILIHELTTSQINNSVSGLTVGKYQFNKLYVHHSDLEKVKSVFPDQSSFIIKDDYPALINDVAGDRESFGLVPLSQLDISIKPLNLDGISWTDRSKYPLQKNIYINGHINAVNQIKDYLRNNYQTPEVKNLLSVGDIQMGRYVGVKINRSGDPAHSFALVKDVLSIPDLTFAQLETPIAPTELTSEGMILVARPESVAGLVQSGIDLVSLSGNHFGDAYHDGMLATFQTLAENNIKYIGAGENSIGAWQPTFMNIDSTRIGFISFVSIMPSSYGAGDETPGTAWIDLSDNQDLSQVIGKIQELDKQCDILVTGFHWGTEYTPHPTPDQIKFAHAAIDAGSDLVVGTHPHVVQADEIYNDTYIIYSLGNFIMDQMWSEETREGVLMYSYIYNDKIISIELVPTQIMDYSQVRVMGEGEGNYILERIFSAGQKL